MSKAYINPMRERYYTKKNGRFIPAHDPMILDGLPNGSWLVIVKKGCTSCKRLIKPSFLELDAALHYLEEGLTNAMAEASKMRPRSTKMSKKERGAWDVYEKTMGKDMPRYFEYSSLGEIAEKGREYLKKVMLENSCDKDKIRAKYEVIKVIDTILDLEV